MIRRFFVTASRGLVPLLADELRGLGAGSVREDTAGCGVRGPLDFGYRICLWSRLASRVLMPLEEIVAGSADELHTAVQAIPWEDHVAPEGTLAVDFAGQGKGIDHTRYGAQRVKDAIVDRFKDRIGTRPSVDRDDPDLRVNVHARGRGYVVSIDLSGAPLHRRGYRTASGPAPLRETLAAGLVAFSGWSPGSALIDPMCGAGTIVIEAALVAADRAPGLARRFGFERWKGHDEAAWQAVRQEAVARAEAAEPPEDALLRGYDVDESAVAVATDNARRAGVDRWVTWTRGAMEAVTASAASGWVVTNPPYGARLGDEAEAARRLERLGVRLRGNFIGWRVALILPEAGTPAALGLAAQRTARIDNGPIAARYVDIEIPGAAVAKAEASPVANRLAKNLKRLRRWAKRSDVTCFRLYDADIPEFNAAVDVYGDQAHVQEYEPPKTIDPDRAAVRLTEITAATSEVLGIVPTAVHVKVRRRQRGTDQYRRVAESGSFFEVREGGHRFAVNLTDYLDTGLFLDHRDTRARLGTLADGARFLNLFCYTATATVYAAAGGARGSVSVDLSRTYLDWARENFRRNGLDEGRHQLVRADVLQWLDRSRDTFDLAFLDPPTFSNSKAMNRDLDVARDQVDLVDRVMERVAPTGTLLFSTNARRFALARDLESRYEVQNITDETIPEDFRRGAPPHRCYLIRRR